MGEKQPAELSRLLPSAHFSTFKEQLLAVGSDGNEGFSLIQQLYRSESLVYDRAICELARRVGQDSGPEIGSEQMVIQARANLGLTLIPFIKRYLELSGPHSQDGDEDEFRVFAREWAIKQLKSCCAAVAALTIADYHRFLASDLMTDREASKLREIQGQIDQFGSRPEARRLVEKLRRQYADMLEVVESRLSVDPVTARCLSYLMNCTSEGFLTDAATAALIMRGNDSAGSRAVRNPLQVLDVADVAAIFDMPPRKMTSMVSKIRRNALEHPEIGFFVDSAEPAMLWTRVRPEPGVGPTRGGTL